MPVPKRNPGKSDFSVKTVFPTRWISAILLHMADISCSFFRYGQSGHTINGSRKPVFRYLPPVVSEKNHIPSSTCRQAEIARTGMVSCPAVRAQISSGHRTVRQKKAGDGIQCGFPSHENTIVFHAAIKYTGTRGGLKSMPFLFAQLGCPEKNHMAMTSAHGRAANLSKPDTATNTRHCPPVSSLSSALGCSFISGDAMNNRSGIYGQPATPAKPYDTTCPVPAGSHNFSAPESQENRLII